MKENKFLNSTLFKLIVAITIFISILIVGPSFSNYLEEKRNKKIDRHSRSTEGYLIKKWYTKSGDYGTFEYTVNNRVYHVEEGIYDWVGIGACYEIIYSVLNPEECYVRWTNPLISNLSIMACARGRVIDVKKNPKRWLPAYGKALEPYIKFQYQYGGETYIQKQFFTRDSLSKSNLNQNDSFLVCFPEQYPENGVLLPLLRIGAKN